jgi:hypothetical protein
MSIQQEVRDLRLFGDALREENRKLFEKMMSELEPEVLEKASLAKDPFNVIAMALIFKQQKMIRILMNQADGREQ